MSLPSLSRLAVLSRRRLASGALLAALALLSCKDDPAPPTERPDEPEVVVDPLPGVPEAVPATVDANPTAPAGPGGAVLPWPAAPQLQPVQVMSNLDSALLLLPAVEGARDYRAYALVDGVSLEVQAGGSALVRGAAIHCAGYRQHNLPVQPVLELLRQLEVTGLSGTTRVVVEALDAACPFPGVLGREHGRVDATRSSEITDAAKGIHEVYTEAEVRARYGSLIVNGHGPGARPGAPAEPVVPRVLARTTLVLTPRPAPAGDGSFFDGFSEEDPPRLVGELPDHGRSQQGKRYENARWSFHTYGAEHAQFFIARGQLHSVLADWTQAIFSSNVAYPKRPAKLYDEGYLHLSYEVASDATSRRYWWLSLCGAPTEGATMDAQGKLLGDIIQTPFFFQEDGRNPSVQGWNCLQVFPRDGWPFPLGTPEARPESDIRVMVNRPNAASRGSVVNVSPDQYRNPNVAAPGWFRRQTADGRLGGPILDDQMLIAPRARFDVYVRRDRVMLYVNGELRLCNDFPSERLTMAEAAVGFGQVLYHSSAERMEFSVDYFDRTGQRYYLNNTPFIDSRSWDNLGMQENVAAPAGFDAGTCYVHRG